mgnify:CR=1 FL=1
MDNKLEPLLPIKILFLTLNNKIKTSGAINVYKKVSLIEPELINTIIQNKLKDNVIPFAPSEKFTRL